MSGIFLKNSSTSWMWEKSDRIPKLATQSQPKLLGFSRTVVPLATPVFLSFLNLLLIVSTETSQLLAIATKLALASFWRALMIAISIWSSLA